MKKYIAIFIACFAVSSPVLAELSGLGLEESNGLSLSIDRYLSPVNTAKTLPLLMMAQAQLTVTPTATYSTVGKIRVLVFASTNGSCSGAPDPVEFGNNGTPTTLNSGHNYQTTNKSNWVLNQAQVFPFPQFSPTVDVQYRLLNTSGAPIGIQSPCIPGGGTCTGDTNCGWPLARSWAP